MKSVIFEAKVLSPPTGQVPCSYDKLYFMMALCDCDKIIIIT